MATSSRDLHINAPELLSRRRRMGDAFVTGLMWLLYTYLWAPLVSLIAWLLGIEFAYDVMVRAGGAEGLKQILAWYGLMLIAIVIAVAAWSLSNRLRFANRDRRHGGDIVSDEALANTFGIETNSLRCLRESRIVHVSLDEQGTIRAIEPAPAPQRERDGQRDRSQLKKPSITARQSQSTSSGRCAAKK